MSAIRTTGSHLAEPEATLGRDEDGERTGLVVRQKTQPDARVLRHEHVTHTVLVEARVRR